MNFLVAMDASEYDFSAIPNIRLAQGFNCLVTIASLWFCNKSSGSMLMPKLLLTIAITLKSSMDENLTLGMMLFFFKYELTS